MECCCCMSCCFTEAKEKADISNDGHMLANPCCAGMMQCVMRSMMNGMMKVTKHNNDATQKEVGDFMVPSSVGKPFLDAPGTFDPGMTGRIRDSLMCGMMIMHRKVMEAGPAPHNLGITWEKYNEHRGYTTPGYVEKSPVVGDIVPDGTIHSINSSQDSMLLAEAKKLAEAAGTTKVIISFVGITCPFARAYCFEDLAKAVQNGVPTINIYIREAEPCDIFDAGGMHVTTPVAMRRRTYAHTSSEDRALVARETKQYFETWLGAGKCNMWMDSMDDSLEAKYEARPWRQYVIEAATGKLIAKLGLAPFNMEGKLKVIRDATATK